MRVVSDPLPADVHVSVRQIPDPVGILLTSPVIFVSSMTHIRVAVSPRDVQIVIVNDGDTRVPVPGSTVAIDIPPDALPLLPC